jgi:hypothetical protein
MKRGIESNRKFCRLYDMRMGRMVISIQAPMSPMLTMYPIAPVNIKENPTGIPIARRMISPMVRIKYSMC